MGKRGRFAKQTSFSVKHSVANAAEDTTTASREPSRRENTGP
jgi:hypothetical protein